MLLLLRKTIPYFDQVAEKAWRNVKNRWEPKSVTLRSNAAAVS